MIKIDTKFFDKTEDETKHGAFIEMSGDPAQIAQELAVLVYSFASRAPEDLRDAVIADIFERALYLTYGKQKQKTIIDMSTVNKARNNSEAPENDNAGND